MTNLHHSNFHSVQWRARGRGNVCVCRRVQTELYIYIYVPTLIVQCSAVAQWLKPDSQSREPGFESSLCYRFKVWAFSFSPRCISPLSCIDEYLDMDSGGIVSAALLECLPEKSRCCQNEQVCQEVKCKSL